LLLLHLGFLWRAALLRGFLIHSDICYFFEPAKALLHESLKAGRLPLWSPYIFCGYPIAAEGQIAAFYPPSLLISWLLPSPAAINWLVISHLLLAAVSMYLLARALGLSPFAAWLAALTFSFSGYLFAHLHHVSLICAAAWLPLTILFIQRAWRGNLLANACLAALAWAAAALCGHPQTIFLTSLTLLFWVAWRLIQSRRQRDAKPVLRAAAVLAITFCLGAGLAAVQLLLTADLAAIAPHGERGALAYVTRFSLLPRHLLGLIAPNWQGTPAVNTYRGERYYWEYVLYIGLAPLALACIGAAARRGWTLAVFALIAIFLALARGHPTYPILRFLPGFADFRVPARFIFLFTFAAALLTGYGWETLAALRSFKVGRRLLICGAAAAVLSTSDLMLFDRPLAPLAGLEACTATPRVVHSLQQDATWGRALIGSPIEIWADWLPPGGWAQNPDGWFEARACLPANVPQSFGLRIIYGYDTLVDPDYRLFRSSAIAEAGTPPHDLRKLSLLGVRWLALPPGADAPALNAVSAPPFTVYLNPDSYPRAFTLGANHRPTQVPPQAVSVDEPRPEHIIVHTDAEDDSFLVLNERWDPGWKVLLDGDPAPLARVESVLMGTPLPGGEHTVEFLYRPRGLIVGRAVTLASLGLWALLMLAALASRARRSS